MGQLIKEEAARAPVVASVHDPQEAAPSLDLDGHHPSPAGGRHRRSEDLQRRLQSMSAEDANLLCWRGSCGEELLHSHVLRLLRQAGCQQTLHKNTGVRQVIYCEVIINKSIIMPFVALSEEEKN